MANIKYKEIDHSQYRNAIPNNSSNLRTSIGTEKQVGEYYFLKVESLQPFKNQARKTFNEEEIKQLSATIKEHGIRQPLTVVPSQSEKDCFEVISGERRLKAAILADLEVVPCIIIKSYDNAEEIALIENIQRTDLHPIEFAEAVASLMKNSKWGDVSEVAARIGKSISTISEATSIAKLPEDIKSYLLERDIRSRDTIRKLITLEHEQMKSALGITGSTKIFNPFSVLRITKEPEGYKVQSRGLSKLSEEERLDLKNQLQEIINKL